MRIDAGTVGMCVNAAMAVVAAFAGWFGVREYRRAGRWRAAELAAAHLQLLTTDDTLVFACQALDWAAGPIVVPARFRAIAASDSIEHDVGALQVAMEPLLRAETLHEPRGLLYRHSFDRLFGYLDSAQELLDLGLVSPVHLSGLRYWLRHLASWPYACRKDGNTVFLPFLVASQYGRVLRLFDSLDVNVAIPADHAEHAVSIKNDAMPRR